MRRLMGILLSLLLAAGAAAGFAEGQLQAPDYILEGFDGDGANHNWEDNLFFERMQKETGIRFELRQHTEETDWTTRKGEILLEENLPDVLFKASLTDDDVRSMAEKGILIDLKPYLAEYAPDLWALLEANPDWMKAVTLPDGSIRALPAINELPANEVVWINRSWLDALDLEMPTTAEELTEVLRAFKLQDPNRNGKLDEIPLSALGTWDLRFLGHAFGITDNDYHVSLKDGKAVSSLTTADNRAFLEWLHTLWTEGLLSHDCFSTADSIRAITDSNAAITYGVFLTSSPLNLVPSEAMDQYEVLEPLVYNGEQVYRDLLTPLTKGTFAITRRCESPERMVAWVNRLYTKEGSLLLHMGVEGEEYTWNEDDRWEWLKDSNTVMNEVLPNATLGDGGVAPGIVTREIQEKYVDNSAVRLVQQLETLLDYAVTPFPPVTMSAADAKTVRDLQSRIAPFAEQRMAEFVTGDRPLDDGQWQEYTEELERLGLNEMLAVWQKYAE